MNEPLLGIRWLGSRLDVVEVRNGAPGPRWVADRPVETPAELGAALSRARAALATAAETAVMMLDHRDLHLAVEESPRTNGRTLDRVLLRLVSDQHYFEGVPVWTRTRLPGGGRQDRWLLAVMPRALLEEIEEQCGNAGLDLVGLYPLASVLGGLAGAHGAVAADTLALVVDGGGGHVLWVGTGEGTLLFARVVLASGEAAPHRLEQEIHRTLSFARQRLGVAPTQVVFGGEDMASALALRLREAGLRVAAAPPGWAADDLPVHAARLGAAGAHNLVRHVARSGPLGRGAVAAAALVALVLALIVAGAVELRIRRHAAEMEWGRQRFLAAERAAAEAEARARQARELAEVVERAGEAGQPELGSVLLRYLQGIVPADSRFTSMELARGSEGWELRLEGTTRLPGSRFPSLVESLETADVLREAR